MNERQDILENRITLGMFYLAELGKEYEARKADDDFHLFLAAMMMVEMLQQHIREYLTYDLEQTEKARMVGFEGVLVRLFHSMIKEHPLGKLYA